MDERVQEREKLAREIHSFIDQVTKEGTQRHESVPLRISLDALHIMLAALRSPGIHEDAAEMMQEAATLLRKAAYVGDTAIPNYVKFNGEHWGDDARDWLRKFDKSAASSIREDATVLAEGSGMLLFDAPSLEDVPVAKTQDTESLEGLSIICNKCGTLVGGEEAGERVRWVTCTICQVATERRERESRASGASRDEGEPTAYMMRFRRSAADRWCYPSNMSGGALVLNYDDAVGMAESYAEDKYEADVLAVVVEKSWRKRVPAPVDVQVATEPVPEGYWKPQPFCPPRPIGNLRNRMGLLTKEERGIQDMVWTVGRIGADVLLTAAVTMLGEARQYVAAYIMQEEAKREAE